MLGEEDIMCERFIVKCIKDYKDIFKAGEIYTCRTTDHKFFLVTGKTGNARKPIVFTSKEKEDEYHGVLYEYFELHK